MSKPSDLMPELQGRFPIRVELDSLHKDDFKRILTEPENSLIKQYVALLETEGVHLDFADDAITELSVIAEEANQRLENIGARRLHTVLEKLLENIMYEAPFDKEEVIKIGKKEVDSAFTLARKNENLNDYIL